MAYAKTDAAYMSDKDHPTSPMEVRRRLNAIILQFSTKKEAADAAGVSPDQLARYVKGQKPPFEVMARLCHAKGVSLDWLASGKENKPIPEANALPDVPTPELATYRTAKELDPSFILLPRYEVRAAAGGGAVVHSEQIVDHLAFKADWVRYTLRRNPAHLILIQAQGDSMEPTISDGDLLLIDTSEHKIRDYAIYVLSFNGDLLVKRVQRKLNGDVVIVSDNGRYPTDHVEANLADQLRIVGQVVWHGGMV